MTDPVVEPLTDEDVALIRQRIQRIRDAELPLDAGDVLDARWLATLDTARDAVPSLRERIDGLENDSPNLAEARGWARHREAVLRLLDTARDAVPDLDVERLRSPRNSLGKLALPKGLMERAVEAAWDGATSTVGDPADGIEMHDLAALADGICDALAALTTKDSDA